MRIKLLIILTALIIIPLSGFSQKRTVKTEIKLEEHIFHIKCVNGGKFLDVPGAGTGIDRHDGANVQLWDLDGDYDRRLKFIPAGEGYYYIQFQHTKANLDVNGCFDGDWFCGTYKKDKGANVQIWSAGTSDPQKWKMEQVSPGKFKIVNKYSGKVLDAAGGNGHQNGCNVQQWDWNGTTSQQWEIIDVETGTHYQE